MDYEKIKEIRQKNNAFCNYISLEILEIGPGIAKSRIALGPQHMNPIGSIHGGVMFTIADTTAGSAASSHGIQVTTLDSTIHFLRPGMNTEYLYAEAKEIKHGKRVSVYKVDVTDDRDSLLATATFTFASLGKPVLPEEE